MKSKKYINLPLATTFLVVVVLVFAVVAQEKKDRPPAGQMMSVAMVTVKPEMAMQFEEMVKKEFNPAFKKGGGKSSHVWSVQVGDGFQYVFVQPMARFAEMDEPSAVVKGLGENAPQFFAKITKMVTGVNSSVVMTVPSMSFGADAKPKMAVVATVTVKPGKQQKLEEFIANDYLPIVKKSGAAGFWASKLVFGGNPDEYTFLTLMDNFAALDKGPPAAQVLKPDELKVFQAKAPMDVIMKAEIVLAKFEPELSIVASGSGTAP